MIAEGLKREFALPEGEYAIRRDIHEALVGATGARPGESDGPNPALAMTATLAATGMSIDQLLHQCGSSVDDGPMLGECRINLRKGFAFDVVYRISRRFLSLERKKSRRFGATDLLRFVATMHEPAGEIVAEVTYTWVLPKRAGT